MGQELVGDPNKFYRIKNGQRISEKKVIEKFAREMMGLNDSRHSGAADVLKCHLMVEYYLTKFLIKNGLLRDNSKSKKPGFKSKLDLLETHNPTIEIFRAGMDELNKIRNRYAHKLSYKIKKAHMKRLMETVKLLRPYTPPKSLISWIELFTMRCCGALYWDIVEIREEN